MNQAKRRYDYGKCHVCGAPMEERLEDQTYRVGARWVLVRNIPTGACPRCGAGVLRAEIGKRVEELLHTRKGRALKIRAVEWSAR